MLDYIENILRSIGDFFTFYGDTLGNFLNWFQLSYPLTFRLCIVIFCLIFAFAPFVAAFISTFRERK